MPRTETSSYYFSIRAYCSHNVAPVPVYDTLSSLIDFFLLTGLDPAGLLFKKNDVMFRLDPGDAAYVDVIHVSLLGIGASQANGHTEFFPNGGKTQNGCSSLGK